MEISGTVTQVLPLQTGMGKKGQWKKQDFIIQTAAQYPKNLCLSLWGDKTETVTEGQQVTASINLESREYNGKWYTEVRAWKVEVGKTNAPQEPSNDKGSDDLPF